MQNRNDISSPFAVLNNPAVSRTRVAKTVHVRACEAEMFSRKLAFQLREGLFHHAVGSLKHFIKTKRAGHSEFAEYRTAAEIHLTMSATLRNADLATLEDAGFETLGDVQQMTDDDLLELGGFDERRIAVIRSAMAELEEEFTTYQELRRERLASSSKGLPKLTRTEKAPHVDSGVTTRKLDPRAKDERKRLRAEATDATAEVEGGGG